MLRNYHQVPRAAVQQKWAKGHHDRSEIRRRPLAATSWLPARRISSHPRGLDIITLLVREQAPSAGGKSCTLTLNPSVGPSGSSPQRDTMPTTVRAPVLSRWAKVNGQPITPPSSPSFTRCGWQVRALVSLAACQIGSSRSVYFFTTSLKTSFWNSSKKWLPTAADAFNFFPLFTLYIYIIEL